MANVIETEENFEITQFTKISLFRKISFIR